jgi:hypothetical protein
MTERNRRAVATKAGDARRQKSAEARADGESPGHGAKSEAVRGRAILALLSERTITGAARRSGVNEKTLRRWVAEDDEFKRELAEARGAMFQEGMNRVQALMAVAIDTLSILMGGEMPPNVRLGAARSVADLGLHQFEADTILQKLEDIDAYTRRHSRKVG